MSKKWYNYFVETNADDSSVSSLGNAAGAPARVTDVVPDATADTAFTEPIANSTELEDIYRSAKISVPPHGYSVLKVAEMLQSEHIKALPADVKKKSILVALDAAGVKISEIVEDAVQRDRALDTYERVLTKNLEGLRAQTDAENKRLQDEVNQKIAELKAKIDENTKEAAREQDELIKWRARKRQEEDRIAEAIGYFVSPNPITTSAPVKDKGDTNV